MKVGIKTPWQDVRAQVVIGTKEFVQQVADKHLGGEFSGKAKTNERWRD
jgi:hypothetical protein